MRDKNTTRKKVNPQEWKKRMLATLSMLLVSAILLTTSTFAWLVLSVAPEVSGITTNIGSNGSLEIALLNTDTYQDMTEIQSKVGESLAADDASANYTWGNLIDLSREDFGLNDIKLLPARLNVEGSSVPVDAILSVPTYGYDGRVLSVTKNTVSAVYNEEKEFSYILSRQDYGVRAIGTSNTLSAQGSALASAKNNIVTYTNSATNAAIAAMKNNGDGLFTIIMNHAMPSDTETYNESHLQTLISMVEGLDASANYLDLALRQGMIVIAASVIGDEDQFEEARTMISNPAFDLTTLVNMVGATVSIPSSFRTWVNAQAAIQNNVNEASNRCMTLRENGNDSYTWQELSNALNMLMDLNGVYFNGSLLSNLKDNISDILNSTEKTLTLAPGSGIFADIANFTGNYQTNMTASGMDVSVEVLTNEKPAYLIALQETVKDMEAADGSTEGDKKAKLHSTYGYALDLAFRCNAPTSDLLLQTMGVQRVYGDSQSSATLGGGSYMEFRWGESDLSQMQTLRLVDAVRVGFMDDTGAILGIAKLNTSNYTITETLIKAPLYLYDYEIGDDGSMIMGERQKSNNTLTSLDQNIAKSVTVVVWLDGDRVDNTMVAATTDTSLGGKLNLQFASSADLIPADNSELKGLTSDRGDLAALVTRTAATLDMGQGFYTTVSWNDFVNAYNYAFAVSNNAQATEQQVYAAQKELTVASMGLKEVSLYTLQNMIAEMRAITGKSDDVARIVMVDLDRGKYVLDEYTEEQFAARVGDIYQVDYQNNLRDEGGDIFTPIYTDESWTTLATALYEAEAVAMNEKATQEWLDNAMTTLDQAYNGLQHNVFFTPYEMDGSLYYYAVSDETDTYGKWYTYERKRIVDDLTIIELDSKAEPAVVAELITDEYIEYYEQETKTFQAEIRFLEEVYPELRNEEIIALTWEYPSKFIRQTTGVQTARLNEMRAWATEWLKNPTPGAQEELVERVQECVDTERSNVYENVEALISRYQQCIDDVNALIESNANVPVTPESPMTADQRTLLTAAINSAKTVAGYSDEQNTDLATLREKVTAAERLLNAESGVTVAIANTVLDELNTALEAAGKTKVTAANTLTHIIPVGSELYEIAYEADSTVFPFMLHRNLELEQQITIRGGSELTVHVLTRSGYLFKLSTTITAYSPAEDVEIEGSIVSDQTTLAENESATLTYSLTCRTVTTPIGATWSYDENTVFAEGNTGNQAAMDETVDLKETRWSTGDTSILTVSNGVITAVGTGTTTVSVTVYTVQGNVYTDSITVTVTPASAATP